MKVESTTYRINNPAQLRSKQHNTPHFTGAKVNMQEEIKPFMPSIVKGLKKVSDNIGEVQNIIINAIGTGLVAPIFIKWNPLSKTDEDTRTYSAWRQPVSAVLTVATQVGITIPFNRMIDRRANAGFYDTKYNKTLFQDKKYIAKVVKKQYPYASKDVQNLIVADRMKEQELSLLRMIRKNEIIMHTDDGKALPLESAKFKEVLLKVIDDKLKYENGELKRCNEVSIPKKVARGEYYRTHIDQVTTMFTDLNRMLNEKKDPKAFVAKIKQLKSQHRSGDKELLAIFEDILNRRGNNDAEHLCALQKKLEGILRNIEWYRGCNSKEDVEALVKQFETEHRINPINQAIDVLNQVKDKVNRSEKVGAIEEFIDTCVHNNSDHRLFKFKFSEKISEELQKQVKNNLKAHKQIAGMIVSFAMLPVTCSLLNWCYPRFMDAVFPNLSNKKHPKEINDLENKANGQKEVKS